MMHVRKQSSNLPPEHPSVEINAKTLNSSERFGVSHLSFALPPSVFLLTTLSTCRASELQMLESQVP